jgi:hypothetical protein
VRLVFVTGALNHGGAERHSIALVNRLGERGHECHAVYVKDGTEQLSRLRGAASTTCLRAARYLDGRSVRALAELLSKCSPGVVVAANAYAAMYARLALRLSGCARRWPSPITLRSSQTSRNGSRCSTTGPSSGARTAWCSSARRSGAIGSHAGCEGGATR